MEHKTCCFAGHTHLPTNKINEIVINLDREIEALICKGVTDFLSGGALGFDQIAAALIISKKEMGKNIRLCLVAPYKGQDKLWSSKQQQLYHELLLAADKVIYISEEYDDFCIRRRNNYMIDQSAYCICALLKEHRATTQTIHYAKKKGLYVIYVIK